MNPIAGGGTGNPFLLLGLNLETANVNGSTLFLFGSVNITGPAFTLPTSGTTFSTTLPILFNGSFLSCPGSFGPFGGCNPPSPNYLGQFNINGTGLLTLSFTGVALQGGGVVWQLSGATYYADRNAGTGHHGAARDRCARHLWQAASAQDLVKAV